MIEITERQGEVLAFLVAFSDRHGYAPSIGEIMRHFGFRSKQGACCHLDALERKGYLVRPKGIQRAMRVTTGAALPCKAMDGELVDGLLRLARWLRSRGDADEETLVTRAAARLRELSKPCDLMREEEQRNGL